MSSAASAPSPGSAQAAQLELDPFDVAVDPEDGVDPVREQRGQQVVADGDDLHVPAREPGRAERGVEGRRVGRDAGDADRVPARSRDARELDLKATILTPACATVDEELERPALDSAERVAGIRLEAG
jgi:hypothetical protein